MAKQPTQRSAVSNKKHLARLEREQIQRRYLLTGAAVIVVLVLAIIIYGVLDQTVLRAQRAVAQVGTQRITVAEFQKEVRFTRSRLIDQLAYIYGNPIFLQFFGSYITQIQNTLTDTQTLGKQVLDQMINDRIVAQEAAKRGITVSEAEIDEQIQQEFGYFANGTPTPTVTQPPFSTATLNPTQLAWLPPTETPAPTATGEPTATPGGPTEAPTLAPTSTPAETATPSASETPQPTPTAYTLDSFKTNFQNYAKKLAEINLTEADFRASIRFRILNRKLLDVIAADVQRDQEQVWARHILVATKEEADAVLTRIKNGEDWVKVAAEVSTDTSNKDKGGDLGWFGKGQMVKEFEDATFALQIGQISDPVQSQFGYHIVQLLGREVRPLTDSAFEQARQNKFSEWLNTAKADLNVQTYDVWKDNIPVVPTVPAELAQPVTQQ